MYAGWPDFEVLQYYSPVERKTCGIPRKKEEGAIGEIQSPQGVILMSQWREEHSSTKFSNPEKLLGAGNNLQILFRYSQNNIHNQIIEGWIDGDTMEYLMQDLTLDKAITTCQAQRGSEQKWSPLNASLWMSKPSETSQPYKASTWENMPWLWGQPPLWQEPTMSFLQHHKQLL